MLARVTVPVKRTTWLVLALLLALAGDGCRCGSTAATDAGSAVAAESGPPKLELVGADIVLDGKRVAARTELPAPPGRVMVLFDALKTRREAWRAGHSRLEEPRSAELTVPADASCTEVASLMLTLADVGYPHLSVHQGAEVLAVDWSVPEPSLFDLPDPDPPLPLQIRFLDPHRAAVHRTCKGTATEVETSALPATLASSRPHAHTLYFGCERGVAFSDVRPVLAALRSAEVMPLDVDGCERYVDGGAPPQVIEPTIGLAGVGGPTPKHLPGELGPTKITSPVIPVDVVRAALAPHLPAASRCFEENRSRVPEVSLGTIDGDHRIVTLLVAPDGGIAKAQHGRTGDPVELCLALELAALSFPPRDAGSATITLDFVFQDRK